MCAVPSVCDSAECITQRFAIRVDSVPSCKLCPARTHPRVFPAYSWVLAKRLLSVLLVVVGKSCLSRVSLSVRVRHRARRGAKAPSV